MRYGNSDADCARLAAGVGRGDLDRDPGGARQFLALPAVTLALDQSTILARSVTSSMLEMMQEGTWNRSARLATSGWG